MAFSTNSLTMLAGRSMTSPAAIWLATFSVSSRTFGMLYFRLYDYRTGNNDPPRAVRRPGKRSGRTRLQAGATPIVSPMRA